MTENNSNASPAIDIRIAGNTKASAQPPASVANAPEGSVMATARAPHGGTLSAEPTDNDVVVVQGISMPIKTAIQHGFLQRTATGGYAEAGADDAASSDARDDEAESDDDEEEDLTEALAFDEETTAGLVNAADALTSIGANPAAAIGQLIVAPDRLPDAFKALASNTGIDEGRALAHVRELASAVEESIGEYAVAQGVSPEQVEDFWSYTQGNVPQPKLAGMVAQAVFMGDASPFKSLVQNFRAAHGSGRGKATKTSKARGGLRQELQETVTVDGMRMSIETARRIGAV